MTHTCQLRMPNQKRLYDHIRENARYAKRMAVSNSRVGESVAICGAGPSLADHIEALRRKTDEIWACNSALPYLKSLGVPVSHGFCIDQGVEMLEEWRTTFDVGYLISSSVHPRLTRHLLRKKRHLTFFHSYLGIPDPEGQPNHEMHLYTTLYQTSVQVGHGLNSVPRAVCLALSLGYTDIRVYGADSACAPNQPVMPEYGTPEYADWMNSLPIYADGRTVGQCWGVEAVMAEAPDIDGNRWVTRPDMVISARHLLDLETTYPGRITLVGDTLPNALRDKGADFNQRLPELTGVGEVTGFGAAELYTPLEAA